MQVNLGSLWLAMVTGSILGGGLTGVRAQAPEEELTVVGRTPLGSGVAVDAVASNVQTATAAMLREQRATDLADYMRRALAGVFINEAQSNPLQPDVQYRGFVGSPLLGLAQGIAVYQDGSRVNEPFGDTVNWALIPDIAIDSLYVMSGSNPLFGLNALGGAIAVNTKSGFSHPGTGLEVQAGSFGRTSIDFETGGSAREGFSHYVALSRFAEDGWRDFSPSEALQVFGKLSWRTSASSIDLSLADVETELIGNGPVPVQLLAENREAVFTRPDITENALRQVNFSIGHDVSAQLELAANIYVRESDIDTFNGDDSEIEPCEDAPAFLCEADDGEAEFITDPAGNLVPADAALAGALINRTRTAQATAGAGLQAAWTTRWRGRDNVFLLGAAIDTSDVSFASSTELGSLDPTRLAIPGGVLLGPALTRLEVDTRNTGFFLSETMALSDSLSLNLAGRYNRTAVILMDQLGTALNGDHRFNRFNPAIGLTWAIGADLSFYAGYGESSRAPSPVELTCADEDDPCRLPNAFLADPPLEQVVAETLEAGLRGSWQGGSWHVGAFRTVNLDDILFISAGALTNQGYFDNVGRTRREGLELDATGITPSGISWYANFSLINATFREVLRLSSPNNPAAVDGEVLVRPGDRLPLVPRQLLKAGIQWPIGDKLSVGVNFLAGSGFPMRGDEANEVGLIGDYRVLNLRASYALGETVELLLSVDNLLDTRYETFGLFGEPDEVLGDDYDDPRFYSPAAPRAMWLGVRASFR